MALESRAAPYQNPVLARGGEEVGVGAARPGDPQRRPDVADRAAPGPADRHGGGAQIEVGRDPALGPVDPPRTALGVGDAEAVVEHAAVHEVPRAQFRQARRVPGLGRGRQPDQLGDPLAGHPLLGGEQQNAAGEPGHVQRAAAQLGVGLPQPVEFGPGGQFLRRELNRGPGRGGPADGAVVPLPPAAGASPGAPPRPGAGRPGPVPVRPAECRPAGCGAPAVGGAGVRGRSAGGAAGGSRGGGEPGGGGAALVVLVHGSSGRADLVAEEELDLPYGALGSDPAHHAALDRPPVGLPAGPGDVDPGVEGMSQQVGEHIADVGVPAVAPIQDRGTQSGQLPVVGGVPDDQVAQLAGQLRRVGELALVRYGDAQLGQPDHQLDLVHLLHRGGQSAGHRASVLQDDLDGQPCPVRGQVVGDESLHGDRGHGGPSGRARGRAPVRRGPARGPTARRTRPGRRRTGRPRPARAGRRGRAAGRSP